MRRLLMSFAVLGLPLLAGCGADKPAAAPVPNDTSFAALKQEYDEATKKFQEEQQKRAAATQQEAAARLKAAEKELEEAKTEEAKAAAQTKVMQARMMSAMRLTGPMDGPGATFSPRFLVFAEKNPQDPSAFESLVLALRTSGGPRGPNGVWTKALDNLRANHVTRSEIAQVLQQLRGADDEATEKLLREVLAQNPDRKIQSQACKALAEALANASRVADNIKGNPDLRKNAEAQQGKDAIEKLIAVADRKKKEAEELTKTLSDKYGDLIPDVAVGKPAPEVEGEDADSKKFKLSDYRGKVVLLDFWGNW